jgi:hypothetical protein
MRKLRPTPEEADAKRAYAARGKRIRSGETPGLFEKDTKIIRPEIRALIDAALARKTCAEPALPEPPPAPPASGPPAAPTTNILLFPVRVETDADHGGSAPS